jgi:hypothetical protein
VKSLILPPSGESPLVDSWDFAAPKEVNSHSRLQNLVPLVFVFDSCFPDHGVPFRLDMPVVLWKAPPWKEQRTF